jgi:hypothetical protein
MDVSCLLLMRSNGQTVRKKLNICSTTMNILVSGRIHIFPPAASLPIPLFLHVFSDESLSYSSADLASKFTFVA